MAALPTSILARRSMASSTTAAFACRRTVEPFCLRSTWARVLLSCLGWAVPLAAIHSCQSAERIYVNYNVLERSVSVASLEAYAREGVIDEDLAAYARYADPEVLQNLRTALLTKADIRPVTVSQFLYSPQGEAALQRLGQVIQPDSRISGFKAIRAAAILAAVDPEGLTLLNFLKKFPARGIRIDVAQSLRIVGQVQGAINQTREATQAVIAIAETEAANNPLPTNLADLRLRGPFTVDTDSVTLKDPSRNTIPISPAPVSPSPDVLERGRVFPVDIYLPRSGRTPLPNPIPVVVISHGLGSDRTSFTYLAQHLASYGFAVMVPEHPGSDRAQMEALLAGVAAEVAQPTEFANRPLDITYLLNYLERQALNNPAYQNLNLKQVGVLGQSFGGYTALAVAGAPINFQQLAQDCIRLENTLNISLLLQCRAEELALLPQPQSNFRDPRVQAVFAMNPIISAVSGQAGLSTINIPTLLLAGSADTVAPSLFEQVRPFTWLTTSDRYLVQLVPGTHFSVIGVEADGPLPIPTEVIGPNPAIAQRYVRALAVAFFQTHIANRPEYRPYLTAAYAQAISEQTFRLDLVQSLETNAIGTRQSQKTLATDATPQRR